MASKALSASIREISGRKKMWIILSIVLLIVYWNILPKKLFNDPYSTVLQASNGELLSASIASDGQWRFPETDSVPDKFSKALIVFEDKRFLSHPGIDILSLGRAIRQNFASGKIVSGGSTISMQVIRMSRKDKSRSILEKCIEAVLATRLEIRYTKEEILALYASHAPFGGNVVGLDAACWRYFGNDAHDMSWAEASLLAVLPNAPSMIHPGKNRINLKAKRDRLLDKLLQQGVIDSFTCDLAKKEPIPEEPVALPRLARHLMTRIQNDGLQGTNIHSTIDYHLQQNVESALHNHHLLLKGNHVYNAAAIVLDVNTGHVLAYAGNANSDEENRGYDVDIISSARSTGSILKPFLYAAMLDEGKILPSSLLPDVPILINGFAPKNFTKEFDGAVHADHALIRSLNVPAVNMLKDYRYEKFHTLLKDIGITTLNKPPQHYGLSLILGGAEATLWDITGMYASMGRTLNHFSLYPGKNRYTKKDFHAPVYNQSNQNNDTELEETSWLSASSIYLTFNALKELYRPGEESGWRYFNSSKKIAWKTGTSFGFRDGWAVGVTPEYVVGVWVGNADGEGRPGLTGTDAAAPLMFDIFSQLKGHAWFQRPSLEMQQIDVCNTSGYKASPNCSDIQKVFISKTGLESPLCTFHKKIHLSSDMKYQVHSACTDVETMKHVNWFVLPPVQEYYFRTKNLSYKPLPPFRHDCQQTIAHANMDMIYPKSGARIFIPRDFDGKPGHAVFEVAHRSPQSTIYWHLDGAYIGSTKSVHHMAMAPVEGKHTITLVDEKGETLIRQFEVISKM